MKHDVSVRVYAEEGGTMEVVSMSNHTACTLACQFDGSACNRHQTWDEDMCDCQCSAPDDYDCGSTNKYWSKTECECKCVPDIEENCINRGRSVDPDTCECIPSGRSGQMCDQSAVERIYVIAI